MKIITLNDGTKKEKRLTVSAGTNPKQCYNCQAPIGFWKLKNGKVVPITATKRSGDLEYSFKVNLGNYGNYIPIHKCDIKPNPKSIDELRAEIKHRAENNMEHYQWLQKHGVGV